VLTKKNKTEEQLRLAADRRQLGKNENVQGYHKCTDCLVLADSIIRNVGTECPDLKVGCFPGFRTEQIQRVIEKGDFGRPDAVVIHVGTNDIKRTRNLDHAMGDV